MRIRSTKKVKMPNKLIWNGFLALYIDHKRAHEHFIYLF